MLQVINANIVNMASGKRKNIKPYPRPGKDEDKKRIGKGAMPLDKLREWIKERQHG